MPATRSFPRSPLARDARRHRPAQARGGKSDADTPGLKPREPESKTEKLAPERPAREPKPARKTKAPTTSRTVAPKPPLARRVIGEQGWRLAERPAGLSQRRPDREAKISVETALIALAAVISAVLILAFGLDLITGWPFDRHSLSMDVTYLLGGGVLAYLSWLAYRELP